MSCGSTTGRFTCRGTRPASRGYRERSPRRPGRANRTGEAAQRIIAELLAGLGALILPLRELTDGMIESSTVAGGIIAAAGETDIDDPNSRLHMRIDVGVCSVDGYHSVDTGKYTLAPMYALEVADRIFGPR